MIVLRAIAASFALGDEFVAPFDLVVASGDVAALTQPSARAASIAARMCAAIVKPTTGTVYVGDYETRLQPPQAKRLVGFVDAGGFIGDDHAFRCETAFRAEVWGVGVSAAQARADAVLASMQADAPLDAPYIRALALALATDVAALVLDQPPATLRARVQAFAPHLAIVETHAGAPARPIPLGTLVAAT